MLLGGKKKLLDSGVAIGKSGLGSNFEDWGIRARESRNSAEWVQIAC